MSRGGARPSTAPVGWVYLEGRYTIRWRRGDPVAYVLGGGQMGDHGMAGVLDTIPVSPSAWTDLAQVRLSRAHDQNTNPVQRRRARTHAYEAWRG
jgi:hypothetical protein